MAGDDGEFDAGFIGVTSEFLSVVLESETDACSLFEIEERETLSCFEGASPT